MSWRRCRCCISATAAAGAIGLPPPAAIPVWPSTASSSRTPHVVLQAALEGQGVALGTLPLIADDLAAGRLLQPFELTVTPAEAYHLALPQGPLTPELAQLRDWLLAEAAATAG